MALGHSMVVLVGVALAGVISSALVAAARRRERAPRRTGALSAAVAASRHVARQGSLVQAVSMVILGASMLLASAWSVTVYLGVRPLGPLLILGALVLVSVVLGVEMFVRQRSLERERALMVAAIRDREEKLSALTNQGLTLAGLVEPSSGRIVFANRAALEVMGVTGEELTGRRLVDGPWPAEARQRLEAGIARASRGELDRFQLTSLVAGRESVMDFSLSPYRDEARRIRWIIAEGRDVTELRRLEERLQEGRRLEDIGRLAGGIAHDFNNLLVPILACGQEIAASSRDPARISECSQLIVEAARRAADLIRRLLAVGRRGMVRSEQLDLHRLLSETLRLFACAAGPGIRVCTTFAASRATVVGDGAQLQGVFLNLCLNARDAMKGDGRLDIETFDADASRTTPEGTAQVPRLGVRVRDTGSGMSTNVRSRVFEPFFTTKPAGKGVGLGLAAVLSTVRDHDGSIEVDSTPGEGSTFTVLLPLSEVDAPHPMVARPRAAAGSGGRVLVVDDEAGVRAAACFMLDGLGFDPVEASEGERALALLRASKKEPSAAVVDVVMPGMDGFTLLARIRERYPSLPLLLCSGCHGDEVIERLGSDASLGFLPKPYDREDLAHALRRLGVLAEKAAAA